MQIVPLKPVPNQVVTVSLGNQTCQIAVYQRSTGLFLLLSVSNVVIVGEVICENLNRIVRDDYLGFVGDLCFIDNQGAQNPDYTGLGGRYSLAYLEESDLVALGLS